MTEHSDMKMENILMRRDGHCVLTDFGLSASLKKGDRVHSFSGTAIYLGMLHVSLSLCL
jgi:serine/threonine protein kinase